ncbi:MAG: hypothetical protein WCK32_10330 [Chlorobiaceae bacterium]
MPSIHPNAAVVDIGSRFHVAAVPLDRTDEPVKTFKSFTGEIHAMALWSVLPFTGKFSSNHRDS